MTRRRPRSVSGTLAVILGDQLDVRYPEAMGLDREQDAILMMEVAAASTAPPSHVQRTVLFLSAMRHHAEALRDDGWRVDYRSITDGGNAQTFSGELGRALERLGASRVACIEPGSYGAVQALEKACADAGVELAVTPDPHFLCTIDEFRAWADGRKELVMEHFYRAQRRKLDVLLTRDGKPRGGTWNYDKQNRKTFKAAPRPPDPPRFEPDEITEQVIRDVERAVPDLPGRLDGFGWPVTPKQAKQALRAFVRDRLPRFGDYQDAMWTGEDTLYHSLLSSSLNLKLLDPREVYEAALAAHESGDAPINSVEGFVRQIIGWREFIRGVYWTQGAGYESRNHLDQHGALPEMYWTGETDMVCLREALRSVLDNAYGHHIARLMLTGNFALLAGVHPGAVNDWYLGMYADAVEWVTAPNVLGMALYADGGVVGTKPYAASGQYVKRMSNYCASCRYDPGRRHGEDACPFSVLYWDFLRRMRGRLGDNQRMALVFKSLERLDDDELVQITTSAKAIRKALGVSPISR